MRERPAHRHASIERLRANRSRARSVNAAWVRLLAGILALLLHASRLSEGLLVPHAVCEHGELTHPSALHPESSADKTEGPEAEGRSDFASEPREAAGEHDHCDASTLDHRMGDVGPSLAEPRLLELDLPAHEVRRLEARPIGLLFLAPKGSPPRA